MPEVPPEERRPDLERPTEDTSASTPEDGPSPVAEDSPPDDPAGLSPPPPGEKRPDGAGLSPGAEAYSSTNPSLPSPPYQALPAGPARGYEAPYPRATASRDLSNAEGRPYATFDPLAHEAPEGTAARFGAPSSWHPEAGATPFGPPTGAGEPHLGGQGYGEAVVAAPPAQRRRAGRSIVRGLREVAETIILALLIFLLVRAVVQNFQVEGSSMEPTLRTGWYLLVNKAIYFEINLETVHKFLPFIEPGDDPTRYVFRAPHRGDIVVFKAPNQTPGQQERDFIKRIIAAPGETVEVRDQTVFIDGKPLDEPYVKEPPNYPYGPETVPEGHYFVLGDNRNNSSDSHVWGMLPKEDIIGQAWLTYWPFSAFGFVDNTSAEPGSGLTQEPAKEPAAVAP